MGIIGNPSSSAPLRAQNLSTGFQSPSEGRFQLVNDVGTLEGAPESQGSSSWFPPWNNKRFGFCSGVSCRLSSAPPVTAAFA